MTTTIQITDDQKATLDDLKDHDREAYKSVLARLIDSYSDGGSDETPPGLDELVTATPEEIQDLKDDLRRDIEKLPERTADELEGRMR